MAQLSSEERIARVEQAPVEVQTMVAKILTMKMFNIYSTQTLLNN